MRGFPKNLNTKEDYQYVMSNFPAEQWVPELENLLETRFVWLPTGDVASVEAGITDDTHKVEVFDNDGKVQYTQYELKLNEYAKIFQLGFTVEEVEGLIASASGYRPTE